MTAVRDVLQSARGITYGRRGEGPAVLLVHGWCLDRTVWAPIEQALVDAGHEVVTPALAGYGASSELAGPYTLERHAADIHALVEELGLTSVTVVGFALGAAILLNLPDYSWVGGIVSIALPNASGAPYARMARAITRDWPLFARRSVRAMCHRDHSDAMFDWFERIYAGTRLDAALAGTELLAAFEPADVEQTWSVPSTFVHGADDTIVAVAVSASCSERFTGAELRVLEDCGHFVPLDQPEALVAEIIRRAEGDAHGTH